VDPEDSTLNLVFNFKNSVAHDNEGKTFLRNVENRLPRDAASVYSVPDDGSKGRPKHVELITPNKKHKKRLHLVGIYMISITKMHGPMNPPPPPKKTPRITKSLKFATLSYVLLLIIFRPFHYSCLKGTEDWKCSFASTSLDQV